MNHKQWLGRAGEDAVAAYLIERGFEIIARNARTGRLEIDLIAKRNRLVICCEVRTRSNDRWHDPIGSLDYKKRQRLRKAAGQWLSKNPQPGCSLRIDAAGVVIKDGEVRDLQYYENVEAE